MGVIDENKKLIVENERLSAELNTLKSYLKIDKSNSQEVHLEELMAPGKIVYYGGRLLTEDDKKDFLELARIIVRSRNR